MPELQPEQPLKPQPVWPCRLRKAFRAGMFFVLLGAIGLVDQQFATAASGSTVSWPIGRPGKIAYTKKTGLRITVDSEWVGSQGYRPIEVAISSAKPAAGDTQITVQLFAGLHGGIEKAILAEHDFEMKQGSNVVTGTILMPQYIPWDFFNWEVWVDGIKDEELTSSANYSPQTVVGGFSAIFITSKDRQNYFDRFSQVYSIGVMTYASTALPEDWIHYSSVDVVIVYPEDLKRWSVTSPDRLAQLLRWVRAGGNLWIVEAGAEYEKLDLVERVLDLSTSGETKSEGSAEFTLKQRGWLALPFTDAPMDGVEATLLLEGLNKTVPDDEPPALDTSGNPIVADSGSHFVTRGYGMGTITAFPLLLSKTFSASDGLRTTEAINQTLLGNRIDWVSRHGNSPGSGNLEFGKFLIPDVGTAPVIEFQLLISLFVIVIGPLNYWLLRRRHQLPLMLLTVPIAALATTVLLFAYGFLADGFGVRVRARSLTTIDQRLGEAVSWARLSYYAGLAPPEGLTIPNDTIVYPILPARVSNQSMSSQDALQERKIVWGKQQNLSRGWLGSRTPTQYLSIAARPSSKKITFEVAGEKFTATNQLGTKILSLFARDHDGNFYMGNEIEADQKISLESSELLPAILALRKVITDNEPEYPPGLEMAQINSRRSRRSRDYDLDPSDAQSLLEDSINSFISPLSKGLAPGSYLAITAQGPEVSLGLDNAIESASFHIVRGTWAND